MYVQKYQENTVMYVQKYQYTQLCTNILSPSMTFLLETFSILNMNHVHNNRFFSQNNNQMIGSIFYNILQKYMYKFDFLTLQRPSNLI